MSEQPSDVPDTPEIPDDPAQGEQPFDDKAHIRHHLDLSRAEWIRAEPEGEHIPDAVEYAFVPHTDDNTYVAMRKSSEPDGVTLVFTMSEWDAFVAGVRDGEFDLPEEWEDEAATGSTP